MLSVLCDEGYRTVGARRAVPLHVRSGCVGGIRFQSPAMEDLEQREYFKRQILSTTRQPAC